MTDRRFRRKSIQENENLRVSHSKYQSTSETETVTPLNQTQISHKPTASLLADLTTFDPHQEDIDRIATQFDTPTQKRPSLRTPPSPPATTSLLRHPFTSTSQSPTSVTPYLSSPGQILPYSSSIRRTVTPEITPPPLTSTWGLQPLPPAVVSLRSQSLSNTSQNPPASLPVQVLPFLSAVGRTLTPKPLMIPPEITPPPPRSTWGPQPSFCPQSIGSLFGDSDCRNKVVVTPNNIPERPVRTEYFTPYPLPPQRTPNPLPPQRTPNPLSPQRTRKPLPPQRIPNPLSPQETPNPLPSQRTPYLSSSQSTLPSSTPYPPRTTTQYPSPSNTQYVPSKTTPPPTTSYPNMLRCPLPPGSLFGYSDCHKKKPVVLDNISERPVRTEYFTPYKRSSTSLYPLPSTTPYPSPTPTLPSSSLSTNSPLSTPYSSPTTSVSLKNIPYISFPTRPSYPLILQNVTKPPLSTMYTSLSIVMSYPSSIPLFITRLASLPSSQNSPSRTQTISPRINSLLSKRTLSLRVTLDSTSNKQTPSPRVTPFPTSIKRNPSTTVTTNSTIKTRELGIKYKVFDEYKNSSREVMCFKHFVFRNGDCQFVNTKTFMKITAILVIKLHREHATSNHIFDRFIVWLNILFIKHFSLPKLAEVKSITIYQHENSSMLYRANVVTVVSSKVDLKDYISTLISVFHGRNLSEENMIKETMVTPSFHCYFHFQSASDYLNHPGFTRVKETKYSIHGRFEYFTCTFSKTIFCPMFILNKSEVFFNDKYKLCLTHFNVCFDSLVYHQGNSMQVCMDDYFAILDRNFRKTARKDIWMYKYTPEGVLSLVLMCLSALCLIITLVIYFLCPELRTLPGKSNMFLSASLLFAQLTFQFGMTQNDFPLPCKLIGLFIHYFWLLSFSWMSACSIQMFLNFGRFTTGTTMNSSKRLLKYCFYAFGSPFLFISTNIVYSLVSSSGKEYGYGLDLCYISYPLMIFITFTAPAFLVTINNVALFVIVCCRIGRHRQLQSASSQFSRSKVLVKLSCLTGCLWLVGFVNHWVKLDVLQYVFIVLNASQGIFIMASFVCTKRVFAMLQKRWQSFSSCCKIYR
ncbi:uncharacterized protein LOC125654643 [Ostrea edulis]|uniref:uncharacterized protein LOC125654643 n=1 Tax=Ostrea edulis TaxID=37623 RepID=UPI0024AF0F5B|nr:uncharacterized protein LOC125654643 [Ostrea edulis]